MPTGHPTANGSHLYREEIDFPVIRIYNLETQKSAEVTNKWYFSGDPVFSEDGKYLFFVSERDFNPVYSETEFNHAYVDMSRIYLVTLAKDTPSPLAAADDQVKEVETETSELHRRLRKRIRKLLRQRNRKVNQKT